MALTQELKEMACRMGRSVEIGRSPVMRELERSVCGCDYGSNGGTTRREADQVAGLLDLEPGSRLLELGAGSGWPGLYIAQLVACDVVLVDIPVTSLGTARDRAIADKLSERCQFVAADAAQLPFADGSFDAVSHTDLLCCTPDKLGVLRESRRVARQGARTVFTVMAPEPSLTASDRQIAIAAGPKFVDLVDDYADLLEQSDWQLQQRTDVTAELLAYLRAERDGMAARARALAELLGSDDFATRMKRQDEMIAAVDSRLLVREMFVARAGR